MKWEIVVVVPLKKWMCLMKKNLSKYLSYYDMKGYEYHFVNENWFVYEVAYNYAILTSAVS